MLRKAGRILDEFDPSKTIVNIGATPEGIGAVYELAKRRGFVTTGIISTQAKKNTMFHFLSVLTTFFMWRMQLGVD